MFDDEIAFKKIVKKGPSNTSKDYGKSFLQIFREADRAFYRIDQSLFAPAVLVVNNVKTGRIFQAGEINPEVLKEAMGF